MNLSKNQNQNQIGNDRQRSDEPLEPSPGPADGLIPGGLLPSPYWRRRLNGGGCLGRGRRLCRGRGLGCIEAPPNVRALRLRRSEEKEDEEPRAAATREVLHPLRRA